MDFSGLSLSDLLAPVSFCEVFPDGDRPSSDSNLTTVLIYSSVQHTFIKKAEQNYICCVKFSK